MKRISKILAPLSLIALASCSSGPKYYSITILSPEGAPVSGVMIQLCDDSLCRRIGQTDENGYISTKDAEVPMGTYSLHLNNIPEPWTFNPNIYELSKKNASLTVNLVGYEAYTGGTNPIDPIEVSTGIKRLSFSSSEQTHYLHVSSAVRIITWSEESLSNPMAPIPSLSVYDGPSFGSTSSTYTHPEGKKNIEVELAADSYFSIDVDNVRSSTPLDFEVVLA